MEYFELNVEKEQEGGRLDAVLSENIDDLSRSYIQKLIEDGCVTVNGAPEKSKKYKVRASDVIRIDIPKPAALDVVPEDIPVEVVYEDEDVIVVNKRRGMVVHPAAGSLSGTLVNALLFRSGSLSSINGIIRPGIVHRIDKDTSGLLMVAKNDKAHVSLAEQLKAHTINRVYHAVAYGNFKEDKGTVSAPIGRHPANRLKMAVTEVNSKHAVTHYNVLERFGQFTYIEARLETGRTHQIRVHMAYIGHPLLGDMVYGPKKKILGIGSQMLHAKILGFNHPRTGKYMEFDSELPEDFKTVLEKLRKQI